MRGVGMLACDYCSGGLAHGEPWKTRLLIAGLVSLFVGLWLLVWAVHRRLTAHRPALLVAAAGLALSVGVPASAYLSAADVLPLGHGSRGITDAYYERLDLAEVHEQAAMNGGDAWVNSLLVARDQAQVLMPLLYAAVAACLLFALAAVTIVLRRDEAARQEAR